MQNPRQVGDLQPRSVGGLAASDLRAAALFVRLGMSLSDDEAATVEEACDRHGLDASAVGRELAGLDAPGAHLTLSGVPWWALDDLCALLVERHHSPLRRASLDLQRRLAELAAGAESGPVIADARAICDDIASHLHAHLAKEENILFPALASLARARREGLGRPALPFPTVLHPIRVMEADHTRISEQLTILRTLAAQLVPPAAQDGAWRHLARELETFDLDLLAHMRFEDDLLFPRALELERQLP